MDITDIKEIVEFMQEKELVELEIEKDGYKIRLHRNGALAVPTALPQSMPMPAQVVAPAEDSSIYVFKSPMVGTFYRSPSPESPAFVDKGARVGKETVLAIIEAMKVMNEIQADVVGEVVDILVDNGQTIEFGQPLFKIRKA